MNFKIGNYHGEVIFNVTSMQACNILIGRLWKYDHSTKHNGRTNKNDFKLNGHQFVLHPILPSQVNEVYQKIRC